MTKQGLRMALLSPHGGKACHIESEMLQMQQEKNYCGDASLIEKEGEFLQMRKAHNGWIKTFHSGWTDCRDVDNGMEDRLSTKKRGVQEHGWN